MKYRFFYFFLVLAVVATGCRKEQAPVGDAAEADELLTNEESPKKTEKMSETPESAVSAWNELGDEPVLQIKTTDGTMTVRLYSETPLHRDNFVKLAKEGFYDGLLFHRVIKDFMIQGGDPLTSDSTKVAQYGSGGPGYTIPAEIVEGIGHKKGALAAARLSDRINPAKASSGSQFYIVHNPENCRHLDGEYTVFGEVVDGLTIIDRIASKRTDGHDKPLTDIRIISITPSVK